MVHFNFIATDHFDLADFESIERFVDQYPDFQTVALRDESELKELLKQLGITDINSYQLNNKNFCKYWDLSDLKFPEFDSDQYDKFYQGWTERLGRDNNMNEYGSLIFLQGLTPRWNTLKHRLIVWEFN